MCIKLGGFFMRLVLGLLLAMLLARSAIAEAETRPLFVEAVDYRTIANVDGCETEPYYKPRQYPQCTDPEKLYAAAIAFAAAHNLPLMIDWGFDECPGCQARESALRAPDFDLSSDGLLASMTQEQAASFSSYTRGLNQIALVKMNSHGSFQHFQDFAERIGAQSVASDLGWNKVWSPLFMLVNPETNEIAANDWFGGYSFCTLIEEINEGLQQVGIATRKDNVVRQCYMPDEFTSADMAAWSDACETEDRIKCFWLGYAHARSIDQASDVIARISPYAKAMGAYTAACEQGVANACSKIGRMMHNHDSVAKYHHGEYYAERANEFSARACDQKFLSACGSLAYGYRYGRDGLERNLQLAARLFRVACVAHDPWACGHLSRLTSLGTEGTEDYIGQEETLLAFACRNRNDWACEDSNPQ